MYKIASKHYNKSTGFAQFPALRQTQRQSTRLGISSWDVVVASRLRGDGQGDVRYDHEECVERSGRLGDVGLPASASRVDSN